MFDSSFIIWESTDRVSGFVQLGSVFTVLARGRELNCACECARIWTIGTPAETVSNGHLARVLGQLTALHFRIMKQNRCKDITMAKGFIDNKSSRAGNLSAWVWTTATKDAEQQFGSHDCSTVGMFIRTIQQRPGARGLIQDYTVCFQCYFLSMAYLPLRWLARIKSSCVFLPHCLECFWFEWRKAGGDWNNEQFGLSTLPQEQTVVVLSAKKSASCGCVACAGFALFEARRSRRYSMAWLEPNGVEETYEGRCSGCGYRCAMLASRQRSMLER